MADHQKSLKDDPFVLNYNSDELRIASEFLTNWLPFLSRDLCQCCTRTLSNRIRSINPEAVGNSEGSKRQENFTVLTPERPDSNDCNGNPNISDNNSLTSSADTNSSGSWKDGADGSSRSIGEASGGKTFSSHVRVSSQRLKMSWADMARDDELKAEDLNELTSRSSRSGNANGVNGEETPIPETKPKTELSREQRENIRFYNVKRKKDFIYLERVNGKIVNILDGLELHTGVFSMAEQNRIIKFVEKLEEMGKNGQLKERTYTAPPKWMKGKGRVTIQFGCCYNYATDKKGNPPGILKSETVDPLPDLLKVMIRRLVRWHVMPPDCVPDSCIVNIYDEGDCIPPHIDNHEFVRPFCTVSFLSECNIVFGSNLKIVGPGDFSGAIAIPLPVGSVLVLNGNGADVAKHCVPAVPTKRISITVRRMDESKRPIGYVPEHDLQGLQPLPYEADRYEKSNTSKPRRPTRQHSATDDKRIIRK